MLKTKAYRVKDFSGTLNLFNSNNLLKPTESIQRQNFYSTERGALLNRSGYTKFNDTKVADAAIKGGYRYYISGGSTKKNVIVCNGSAYSPTDAGVIGDAIKTGLTASAIPQFATIGNKMYMVNGVDNNQQLDGSTWADMAGSPPKAYCIEGYASRVFLSKNPTYKSRVYYSDLKAYSTFGANSYIDYATDDGDEIMQIIRHMDKLIVFKRNYIWVTGYTGAADITFSVDQSTSRVGTVAPRSVVAVGRYLVFLAADGVYVFDGVDSTKISEPIESEILAIASGYRENAVATLEGNFYKLFYTGAGATTNNSCLVCDVSKLLRSNLSMAVAWSKFTNFNVASVWKWDSDDDVKKTLLGESSATGFIYNSSTGLSDNNAASPVDITSIYETKAFDIDSPELIKKFKKLFIKAYAAGDYNLQIAWNIDEKGYIPYQDMNLNAGTSGLWGATPTGSGFVWGQAGIVWGTPTAKFQRFRLWGRGKTIRFKFKFVGQTAIKLYNFEIYFKPKKIK